MKNKEIIKWTITSIVVILGVFLLIRLGFWQLDRLDQRRKFNNHYLNQISLEPINLNEQHDNNGLVDMEYREIFVFGHYDFDNEIYLQNQAYNNQPGYRVVTPLKIDGFDLGVFIDRGWISFSDLDNIEEINADYSTFQEIKGIIRNPSSNDKIIKTSQKSDSKSNFYLYVDIDLLQTKTDYELLPIYIQLTSEKESGKPIPQIEEIEITEGPHFGYALQWFFFASLLGFGYPLFMRKQLKGSNREDGYE